MTDGEHTQMGPYSSNDFEKLAELADMRLEVIKNSFDGVKGGDNLEDGKVFSDMVKQAEDAIHKKTGAISKHGFEEENALTPEKVAAYLFAIQKESSDMFRTGSRTNPINAIGDDDVPENLVTDQMLIGIKKPDLEDIMNTKMGDDDE